jgi:opacity protein-like surface antigen
MQAPRFLLLALAAVALAAPAQAAFADSYVAQQDQYVIISANESENVTILRDFRLDHVEPVYAWLDPSSLDQARTLGLRIDVAVGPLALSGGLASVSFQALNVTTTQNIGMQDLPGNVTLALRLIAHLPPQRQAGSAILRVLVVLHESIAGQGSGGSYDPTIGTNLHLTLAPTNTTGSTTPTTSPTGPTSQSPTSAPTSSFAPSATACSGCAAPVVLAAGLPPLLTPPPGQHPATRGAPATAPPASHTLPWSLLLLALFVLAILVALFLIRRRLAGPPTADVHPVNLATPTHADSLNPPPADLEPEEPEEAQPAVSSEEPPAALRAREAADVGPNGEMHFPVR